jgi:hypothetical protein
MHATCNMQLVPCEPSHQLANMLRGAELLPLNADSSLAVEPVRNLLVLIHISTLLSQRMTYLHSLNPRLQLTRHLRRSLPVLRRLHPSLLLLARPSTPHTLFSFSSLGESATWP